MLNNLIWNLIMYSWITNQEVHQYLSTVYINIYMQRVSVISEEKSCYSDATMFRNSWCTLRIYKIPFIENMDKYIIKCIRTSRIHSDKELYKTVNSDIFRRISRGRHVLIVTLTSEHRNFPAWDSTSQYVWYSVFVIYKYHSILILLFL